VNYVRLSESEHRSQLPFNETNTCKITWTTRTLWYDDVREIWSTLDRI